jgi:histone-lysine N-methyltransferase SETMAR
MITQGRNKFEDLGSYQKFGWTVLPHPPYSPALAPSDFQLFGSLKNAIRGTKFETDDDVIHAVITCLREQDNTWYRRGIHTFVSHRPNAVEVDGDCVEK